MSRFKTSDLNCRDKLKRWCVERCDPDSKSVACLQHGDLHFNNLLFKREGDNWRIVIVDWQLAYTGWFIIIINIFMTVKNSYTGGVHFGLGGPGSRDPPTPIPPVITMTKVKAKNVWIPSSSPCDQL